MVHAENPLPDGFEMSIDGTHSEFQKPIEQSPNDTRSYRLLRLKNSLEVLVIHDADTDKSAAAMDISVGHMSDPDNIQGLAHFLEHMLFMGTEKYPRENEFSEYLASHSGQYNGTTFAESVNYLFEVGSDHFEGALDRFSQFFISPRFDESCTDREIHAVDSEFKLKLQDDYRRNFQLTKHLSSRDNPYWHFGTGNLLTLKERPDEQGINVREELLKFYNKYYSANIMKLVILGRDSLDVLSKWAIEKFSDIKNLGISSPSYPNPILTSNEYMKTVYVRPVKDIKELQIKFVLPGYYQNYTSKPLEYISHLIGHEGRGSIISLLKKRCWANSLSTSSSTAGEQQIYKINIQLTKEGLCHHEDIAFIIFQYLYMLRREGYQAYIMEEKASLSAINFRFKEKTVAFRYVSQTAENMRFFAPERILSGSDLIRDYDPELVTEYLHKLAIDKWYYNVVTQDISIVPGGNFTEQEPWYGVQYHIEQFSPQFQERLRNLGLNSEFHPELHLPSKNIYIPEEFKTVQVPTPIPQTHPALIMNTPLVRLWYKKDDTFWIPKVNMSFLLTIPVSTQSPINRAKTSLYRRLVLDTLKEDTYLAGKAGLTFTFETTKDGFTLSIEGYNDKAHIFLQKIVHTMKTLQVDRDQFTRVKEVAERDSQNFEFNWPVAIAGYFSSWVLSEDNSTYLDILEQLPNVTPDNLQSFIPELFEHLHIEGLVHGNMDIEQSIKASEIIEDKFSPSSFLKPSELVKFRSIDLPDGSNAVYQRDAKDPKNINSGIDYYIQVGNIDNKNSRAFAQIIAQIIEEPCYNQLRTNEQLGYAVYTGIRRSGGTIGIRIYLQSERDPIHVESRIENFLSTRIGKPLENMTEEEYLIQTRSLIQKKLEKYKNLKQETQSYWEQVTSGFYNFDEKYDDVDEIESITLEMTREFFKTFITPLAPRVKKLSTYIRSLRLPPPGQGREGDILTLREGVIIVRDVPEFKDKSTLSQTPKPTMDLSRY